MANQEIVKTPLKQKKAIDLKEPKLYTLEEIRTLIANLGNCTSELRDESMSRVKLHIPQELLFDLPLPID